MTSFAAGALPMALQFRNLSFSSSHLTPPRSQILGTPLSTPPLISLSSSPQTIPSIYCGRGDRKTAKGKRFNHSFGNGFKMQSFATRRLYGGIDEMFDDLVIGVYCHRSPYNVFYSGTDSGPTCSSPKPLSFPTLASFSGTKVHVYCQIGKTNKGNLL